ncbi:MAG TPA: enoyl-CoA hydratase/isomerase family protein, partial [Bradyrhizobium sp.]|nr:enoyl-CoA hydratase/isomerase family protein [Bradyrhizobium sp.]
MEAARPEGLLPPMTSCRVRIVTNRDIGRGQEMPDILVTTRDSVGVVSLNRPEARNAVTLGMWRELAGIFSSLADDDSVRAIVLMSSGADFCVGADVS